jgi:hypothetical protein
LVRIGANRGCDFSFATGSALLDGSRRAVGFLARAGVVATIVVFLLTGLSTSFEPATHSGRAHPLYQPDRDGQQNRTFLTALRQNASMVCPLA